MDKTLGIVRHVLTFAGGYIVAKGWMDDATMNNVIGALITVGGAVWSILSKKKAE